MSRASACALLLVVVACAPAPTPPAPCNGSVTSCGRRFDEVTIAATHNAFAYAAGGPRRYSYPNQDAPVTDQLEAGIRGLGLRPAPYFGDDDALREIVHVTHNPALRGVIGQEPLRDVLAEVRTFLESHPREIVSIYSESAVNPERVVATVAEAGLEPYLYPRRDDGTWPTLEELIAAGTRLVWFEQYPGPAPPPWMLDMWDELVDTDYRTTAADQFRCDYYRGEAKNRLFFLNQFLYLDLGDGLLVPDRGQAAVANEAALIDRRARECHAALGRWPNVIYVDFYGVGDVVGAVRALNEAAR